MFRLQSTAISALDITHTHIKNKKKPTQPHTHLKKHPRKCCCWFSSFAGTSLLLLLLRPLSSFSTFLFDSCDYFCHWYIFFFLDFCLGTKREARATNTHPLDWKSTRQLFLAYIRFQSAQSKKNKTDKKKKTNSLFLSISNLCSFHSIMAKYLFTSKCCSLLKRDGLHKRECRWNNTFVFLIFAYIYAGS